MLRETGGQDLLDDVERLRELSIRAYDDRSGAVLAEAEALVEGLSMARAEQVARAFTCYFHLANLAEEYHRVRVLREREAEFATRATTPDDSLPEAFEQLVGEVGREEALRRLRRLEFRPVLTAHPTEARRRAVSGAVRRIATLLDERDAQRLGGTSLAENERRLLAEIDTMWRTAPIREHKPSVLDEVKTALGVFDATMFDTFPTVYRRLDDWLLGDEAGREEPLVRPFVSLGTWIGGDRDGNPNVTADVTRQAAAIAADHALAALEQQARAVGRKLTLDQDGTPPSDGLRALWERQRRLSEAVTVAASEASPREPHRAVLLVVADRIAATRARNADLAYPNAEQLESDLRVVQESLVAAGAPARRTGTCSSSCGRSRRSASTSRSPRCASTPRSTRGARRDRGEGPARRPLRPHARGARHVPRARRGPAALRHPCRPSLHRVVHAEAGAPGGGVRARGARVRGLRRGARGRRDPAVRDLRRPAGERRHPRVHAHAAAGAASARGERASRRGHARLLGLVEGRRPGLRDARPARRAEPHRAVGRAPRHHAHAVPRPWRGPRPRRRPGEPCRARPAPGSVDGRFKLTEQGEVILARYGDPTIASRHIEQVAAATLLASAPSTEKRNAEATERYRDLAAALDESSRRRFHELVRADGFPQWFSQVTPLEEVGLLPIGSRPARRGLSVSSLDDLRAIPWVFSWSQARINLAGWYGLGTALREFGDLELLREAHREWPLFATLLDNVEMSLAKTDERIAERYLALGDRDDLAQAILDELRLTREQVLAVTENAWPLAGRRVLGRAVQLRSPYVDALSLLQVRALRGLRSGAEGP